MEQRATDTLFKHKPKGGIESIALEPPVYHSPTSEA